MRNELRNALNSSHLMCYLHVICVFAQDFPRLARRITVLTKDGVLHGPFTDENMQVVEVLVTLIKLVVAGLLLCCFAAVAVVVVVFSWA